MKEDFPNIHDVQKLVEKHEKLETDFAKLQVTTQIENYAELLGKFREMEENNFSQFNYINELSHQIKGIDKQIGDLNEELDDLMNFEYKSNIERKKYLRTKDQVVEEFERETKESNEESE